MRKLHSVWQSLHHETCSLANDYICRKYPFLIGSASYVGLEKCFPDLRINRNCCCSWCQASIQLSSEASLKNDCSRPGASHMGVTMVPIAMWDPMMRRQVIPTADRTKKWMEWDFPTNQQSVGLGWWPTAVGIQDPSSFPQASVKSFGRSNCLTPDECPEINISWLLSST